jgi:cysteine desulfurase
MDSRKPTYLDYAAATPVDGRVLEAMRPYFADNFYNPSATYLAAKEISKDLTEARSKVAHRLGARPGEIIFTAGGTEGNNLAIQGIMRQHHDGNIVVSAVEHESILAPAKLFDYRVAPVDKSGSVDLKKLAELIDDKTVLVSIMYANNEVGTILPIREISQIIHAKRAERVASHESRVTKSALAYPIYFHTDACQAANYLDLHASRLGVDLMTLNGGKIYGPKQSGVLFVKTGVELRPIILGGGQERNLRSGTENVAGAIGFASALELAQIMRQEESRRLTEIQSYFIGQLKSNFPDTIINGSLKKRLPNNLHVTFPGIDNERLLMQLDEAGILSAAGSACSASDEEPSHVLRAMGVSDTDAQSSLRFTTGRSSTLTDIDTVVNVLSHHITKK